MTRIIGIMSGKGGVGKTTTAINLGSILAQKYSKSVAIIDCNVTTPHVGLSLGILHDSYSTLNDVLRGKKDLMEVVHPYSLGLSIIPASLSFDDLKGIKLENLKSMIKKTMEGFDVVLLDAAPGLGKEAMSAMQASDELVFVTTPYTIAVSDILRTKKVANELGKEIKGIIVNMRHNTFYELTAKEIENFTQIPVLGNINYDHDVIRSLIVKTPLIFYNQNSKTVKEFTRIAGTLLGEVETSSPSFFDRVMSIFRRQPSLPTV
ncbi:MAG: P-loop NTPase [Candidatus Aenigmatarchaeota archaeon]